VSRSYVGLPRLTDWLLLGGRGFMKREYVTIMNIWHVIAAAFLVIIPVTQARAAEADLSVLGVYDDLDVPSDVSVSGKVVYVANERSGLQIIGPYILDVDGPTGSNRPARIVYVDKDATGPFTGTSWEAAFTRIQDGIDAAATVDSPGESVEVWVAEGRYNEPRFLMMFGGHGQNVGSLQLQPGVAVYGGFVGTETVRGSRDWFVYETVIDGSRSRGGLPAYHVIIGADDAIIDGFTITGGEANLVYTDEESGGGMLNQFCSPTVANCTFLRNKAFYGGGGIANKGANPRIVNCRFYGNDGGAHAGGVYNDQSSPLIVNCLFVGNHAGEGGAMIGRRPAAPRVVNCTFVANQASIGGALLNPLGTELVNAILWANESTMGLGDQVYGAGAAATFSYCSIEGGINGPGFGGEPVIDGGHNLAEDPQFVRMPDPGPDEAWGTIDDDYSDLRLRPISSLIDKGNSAAVPVDVITDIARRARIMGAAVEIGAYEFGGPIDLWAVDLLRGWHELADGAAVEPGEAIRIRAHALTANPYLHVLATSGNGDVTMVLELDTGGMAYESAWYPLNAGVPPDGRINITVCAAECDDCPLGRCITRWVTMTAQTDKADLVGNDLYVSVPPGDWGGAMQVDLAILNRGVIAAQASQAGFYLSRDSVIVPGSDMLLGQIDIPTLGATGLHVGKAVFCLPATPPDGFDLYGTYYVGMVADAMSQVTEDFEHNNMNRGVGIDLTVITIGPDDTSGPMVAGCTPQATSIPFDHLDITFSEPVRPNTFSRADITLLDPQGREIPVSDPELLEGTSFRIHFSTQAAFGDYRLLIGPWIEDSSGNPMNQNGNAVNGEGADDRFDTTIDLYDDTPPYIEMMTVQNKGVGSVDYVDLTFSEAIDPASLTVDDVKIVGYNSENPGQYYASEIESLSGTEFRIHTRYQDHGQERPLDRIQAYEITVGSDVQDVHGNAMDQRVKGGATREYVARFPVCSGFATALSTLNTGETAMVLLRTAVADALRAAFPDVGLPDALDLREVIGGVPLTQTDLLPGAEKAEFFRITAGGAVTAGLGFSAEGAGITPSLGAHLKRDLAKVEQGLVVEATTHSVGPRTYKIASALTAESGALPVTLSGQAETFLEFPGDLSEFTLGYTFSLAAGIPILGELASEVEVDAELADVAAGFAFFFKGGASLEAPVMLSATLSPGEFIAALGASDLTSALDRYISQCALSAWPGTAGDGDIFGLVAGAMGTVDYWNLSVALDTSLEGAMGAQAGLALGFETPFEIGELSLEAGLSASAGARGSVNLFQWTLTIPVGSASGASEVIFNGDFELGLATWSCPSGRAQAVSDGSGGLMTSLGPSVAELSRPIFLPVDAVSLSFDCAFSPNVSSSSLRLQLNGQTVWQATGGPTAPSIPVQVDVSVFRGQMVEARFLFWNPDDANAVATIDNIRVDPSMANPL